MTPSRHRTAVLGLALVALAACTTSPPGGRPTGSPPTSTHSGPAPTLVDENGYRLALLEADRIQPATASSAGDAIGVFGTALFAALPADGNAVVSPYSVYTALAMVRPGASGACATELDTLLGTDSAAAVTAVDAAMADAEVVPSNSDPRELIFDTANSVWAADGTISPAYLEHLSAGFDAPLYLTDFRADPEAARVAINGWVAERTRELIPELIGPGVLDESTVLTLVNALYLAAQWQPLFLPSVVPLDFATPDGTVAAPSFVGNGSYSVAEGDDWQSVTIPYVGNGVAMTLIVPDEGMFDDVAGQLNAELVSAATSGTATVLDTLEIPTFALDTPTDLTDVLSGMGGGSLFDGRCLTEMVDGAALDVAAVVHQAVVEIDENGTVAAAATAMAIASSAAPQSPDHREVIVDRPFFFVIHDTDTGAPLFLGRILDPTA